MGAYSPDLDLSVSDLPRSDIHRLVPCSAERGAGLAYYTQFIVPRQVDARAAASPTKKQLEMQV